jgi:hypothetical protein
MAGGRLSLGAGVKDATGNLLSVLFFGSRPFYPKTNPLIALKHYQPTKMETWLHYLVIPALLALWVLFFNHKWDLKFLIFTQGDYMIGIILEPATQGKRWTILGLRKSFESNDIIL